MARARAPEARVALTGRFSPGEKVSLVEVAGPHVLRPPDGARPIGKATVDESGRVVFEKGVKVGARYFICGRQHGQPLYVRVTGRAVDDPNGVLEAAPNVGV